jgi:hypothetical protein
MDELNHHNYITIPQPPHPDNNPQKWIETLAELAKTANKQARKITTKYIQECIKKPSQNINNYTKKNPQKINNRVFKNQDTPPLDCIRDRNNNILTSPEYI